MSTNFHAAIIDMAVVTNDFDLSTFSKPTKDEKVKTATSASNHV